MNIRICNLLFIMLLINSSGYTVQNDSIHPKLTKKEMKQDIDFLVKAIKEIDPHIPIRSQVTGVDIYAEIDSLQAQAAQLESFEEFYYLAQQILLLSQDQHNNFQSFYPEKINKYMSPKAVEISEACEQLYDKYHPISSLPIKYINGNYYSANELTSSSNHLKKLLPASAQILEINGISMDEYVKKWNRKVDNSVRWDSKHQKYYSYRLYAPKITGLGEENIITYKYNDSIVSHNFNNESGHMNGTCYLDSWTPNVFYLEDENILYIRLPEMEMETLPFFKEQLWQYKSQPIKKVLIDIRYNGGGSDSVWMKIISDIIATPLVFKSDVYMRNTPLALDYIHHMRQGDLELDTSSTMSINNTQYIAVLNDDTDTILHPSAESIKYEGPIYVLVNERCFSSSLAFIKVCNRTNGRLLTVGQPTGFIGGKGITPFFLSLPNSKLIFEIASILDATEGREKIKDYYNHKVDIPVPLGIVDYIFEENYKGKRYGKDFLLHYDPVFRKIAEL